ncbi:ribulose-phosphate 3-epimerase [Hippea jasoniae]|uniref:ribulose-phosphate 3-epimerase n=1 Tax=Hippea jasoniae TaxID=944479 RepID=UPI000550018D|nr:ribulose-phosphate 3-epimerase [Hippea jasoniae]
MTKKYIAPSLLSANFLRLEDELKALEEAKADMLHLDIMDGHFVPNLTFGPFIVKQIRRATRLPLDVHLMIEDAEKWVDEYIYAGADFLCVHYEAVVHLDRVLRQIKQKGVKNCVSINPSTSPSQLEFVLELVDMVLVMSVNPGFGGQSFIEYSLKKVEWLNSFREKHGLDFLIEVDGGVNVDNIGRLSRAGADVFVAGSAIFNQNDYASVIKKFREQI